MLLLTASRRRSSPRLRLVACCARAKYSLAHLRCMTGDIISFLVLAQRPDLRGLTVGRRSPAQRHRPERVISDSLGVAALDRRELSPRNRRGGFDGALGHIVGSHRRLRGG